MTPLTATTLPPARTAAGCGSRELRNGVTESVERAWSTDGRGLPLLVGACRDLVAGEVEVLALELGADLVVVDVSELENGEFRGDGPGFGASLSGGPGGEGARVRVTERRVPRWLAGVCGRADVRPLILHLEGIDRANPAAVAALTLLARRRVFAGGGPALAREVRIIASASPAGLDAAAGGVREELVGVFTPVVVHD
ncbi:hypothetical protein [Demequina pelophila]|uniref:hypothetical protein n=1 Tax=Demequina pelophila TaxID=1638984 RepID=UPI000780F2B7|nr:hypothetical protein [Demequina pelophila]